MKNTILLFGGGKESVYQLHHKHNEIAVLLHFNYGQKSFERENYSAEYYSKKYSIEKLTIELPFFILPPAIKDGIDCNPAVAQRNLVFTSIALHIAEARKIEKVLLGAIADSISFDATGTFIERLNRCIGSSPVKIESLSQRYAEGTIIRSLIKNKVDISELWSCDNNTTQSFFCGKCAKCTTALHNLYDYYADDKDILKYYQQKYFPQDVTNALNNEFRQKQQICKLA